MNTKTKPKSKKRADNRKHATFAPSTMGNRDICPAYRSSKDNAATKKFSDEGTAMHAAAETGDVASLNDRNELLSAINTGTFARSTVEQQDCVKRVLDYLLPLETNAQHVFKEIRLEVLPRFFVEFGTADRLIVKATDAPDQFEQTTLDLHIVDFKFGKIPVSPAWKNMQGMCYAVGAWAKYPTARSLTVHFLQPRVREEADTFTFFRTELEALKFRIARAAANVQNYDKDPTYEALNPHFENCQYCGRIGKCPAVTNIAIAQANAYVAGHPEDGKLARLQPIESPSMITDPVMMARARAACTILDTWSKSVKARANVMVTEEGQDIPGFKLLHKQGSRNLDNGVLMWDAIEAWNKNALPKHQVTKEELLSVLTGYDMEAFDGLIKEKADKGQMAKLLATFTDHLKEVGVLRMSGGGTELRRDRSQPIL